MIAVHGIIEATNKALAVLVTPQSMTPKELASMPNQYIQTPLSLQLESPIAPVEVPAQRDYIRRTPQTPVVDARIYGVPEFKKCRDCGKVKASAEFNRVKDSKDLLSHYCKTCSRERSKASWRKVDPRYKKDRHEAAYAKRLVSEFGITIEQYQQMFDAQDGLCAICGEPPTPEYRLAVDHDHDTGKIRSLLCRHCNVGIGHLRDDPTRLMAAAEYLWKHGK